MKNALKILLLLSAATLFGFEAPKAPLQSAMLGAADMRQASIWLNGAENSVLTVRVFKDGFSKSYAVALDEFGIGKKNLWGLEPNSEYNYEILDAKGGVLFAGKLKTSPDYLTRTPPPDFSIAVFGKCHTNEALYDEAYKTPGGEYEIFGAALAKKPQAVIWAANADTLRTADLGSRGGYFSRFIHSRKQKESLPLLTAVQNIGVMAQNAYAVEKADKTSFSKGIAQDTFKAFWPNPTFGDENTPDNTMRTCFRYGDAEFFVVDDCSQKDNIEYNKKKREFLGRTQLNWLKQSLKASTANFKIVVMNTPVCNPAESFENFTMAKNEKNEFFDFVQREKISGLVFVSANKNYGEISRMVRAGAYPVFDITAGPTTARPAESAKELNYFRVPASGVFKRSFVLLNFSGKESARCLTVKFFDSKGAELFSQKIDLSDISAFN